MEHQIIPAVKCAPTEELLAAAQDSGISAVELFLWEGTARDPDRIIELCRRFPFKYAVHGPNDCYRPAELKRLVEGIGAQVVVMHDILWEDEWRGLAEIFRGGPARICVENIASIHESERMERRFGMGRCLDMEHIQLNCCGFYEGGLGRFIRRTHHVHMTGYEYGTKSWHTPIDRAPAHCRHQLDLLAKNGYRGMVVSEADAPYQNVEDFRKVREFFLSWERSSRVLPNSSGRL